MTQFKKLCFALCLVLFFSGSIAFPCSTFMSQYNGQTWMGKNYDWFFEHGAAFVNKRNVEKTALVNPKSTGQPAKWKSIYGSVTLNQFGREFPQSGMNEKGLVIEVLQLVSSKYPDPSDPRPYVNEAQWVQYHLDQFETTQEVLKAFDQVRIESVLTDVHYFVCDKTADCAVIEFLDGKAIVTNGNALNISAITNNPYERSYAYYLKNKGKSSRTEFSLNRFLELAQYLASPNRVNASYAQPSDEVYRVLDSVIKDSIGAKTVWQISHNLSDLSFNFKTKGSPSIKQVDLTGFDFSCLTPVKVLEMGQNLNGKVNANFVDFTDDFNKKLIAKNSKLISNKLEEAAGAYPSQQTHCLE